MSDLPARTHRFELRLTESEKVWLNLMAEEHGLPAAVLLRAMIRERWARKSASKPPRPTRAASKP